MDNQLIISDIMKLKTMPEIYYQLEQVGNLIKENLQGIDEMECNEENKIEVKKRKAEINNTLKNFEENRKAIKEAILEPYKEFETKYSIEIKTPLEMAENTLKTKINTIEEQQKQEKRQNLVDFFNNYQEFYHLEDIISFDDCGLNITLSASEKSLKEQIIKFCEKVSEDLVAISSEEFRDEVLLEYKNNGFNYTNAIIEIRNKHKLLEEMAKKNQEFVEITTQEQQVVENVNTLMSAPIEIKEDVEEDIIEVAFKCKGTKQQLLNLKNYMKENNISYE